ncbi:MAG: hypothetical protein VW338_06610 [Rhodospirillaceae bacterium]
MIDRAMPGQILVGDFNAPMPDRKSLVTKRIDTVEFIERAQETLSSLEGLRLSGDSIADKHGRTRNVYNAKVNIYRETGEPVFLGVQERDLGAFKREDEEFV